MTMASEFTSGRVTPEAKEAVRTFRKSSAAWRGLVHRGADGSSKLGEHQATMESSFAALRDLGHHDLATSLVQEHGLAARQVQVKRSGEAPDSLVRRQLAEVRGRMRSLR